ncbi:MAG TPA: hypothetical protein DD377_01805 [Firmicutes bacterium]|nr:hypothetical protein [Bacillota bacterium]
MKIFYLTTAIRNDSFDLLIKKGEKINPAGQNFHSKLIEGLKKIANLEAYSLPPTQSQINNDASYNYFIYKNRILKKLFAVNNIKSSIKKRIKKEDVILFDSLSLPLTKIASYFSKRGYKTIPFLTDSPFNITFLKNSCAKKIINNVSFSSGSISLTKELTKLFNLEEKPSLEIQGIMDEFIPKERKENYSYIYFAGALFKKYGVEELLSAFLNTNPDYKLLIAGHGDMENELTRISKNNAKIKYLGQVSKEDNYAYEHFASLVINPRPYPSIYDSYSIPSKLIEYLCLSKYVCSTFSTPLDEYFKNSINLIEGTIESFFLSHLDENKKFVNLKENDPIKNLKIFEAGNVCNSIFSFLKSLN